ncbi:MAG: tetratricopeptide repeat protein [candidate division NC10 bacterium]|nr:tetratricopeptide repeat protein [candidate division NC10 bacterium]
MNIAGPMRMSGGLLARMLPYGLCLYIFTLSIFTTSDPDFWWHLKNGEQLLAVRRIAGPDVFAYTSTNARWVQHYWLFDILLFLACRAVGFKGLTLLKAAFVTSVFWILYRSTERSIERTPEWLSARYGEFNVPPASRALNCLLVALAAGASRPRFTPRAELASLLMFVLAYHLLATRRERSPYAPLWLLPLQLFWTNVHGSFILGLLLPWPFVLADIPWIDRLKEKPTPQLRERPRHWAILVVSAALLPAVSLLNPSGYRLLLFPFRMMAKSDLLQIAEWISPLETMRREGSVTDPDFWILLALLGIALLVGGLWVRRLDLAGGLLAVVFAVLALKHVRMISFFALTAPPFIAATAVAIRTRMSQRRDGAATCVRWAGPSAVWLVLIILGVHRVGWDARFIFGLGIDEWSVPSQAARFIEEKGLHGRMLNSHDLGGYLIWRLGPERKVFIDGRYETYSLFPETLLADHRRAFRSADQFQTVAARYGITYVILSFLTFDSCLRFEQLGLGRTWALVFWDDIACIYLARVPEHGGLIETYEYRHARYGLDDPNLSSHPRDPIQATKALEELQRAIDASPFHERALQGQAYLYFAMGAGSYNQALSKLGEIHRLNPKSAWAHLMTSQIFMNRGDNEVAMREAQAALRLDPSDPTAHAVLAKLYARQGDRESAQREWKTYDRLAAPPGAAKENRRGADVP